MKRKILALALSVALVLTLLPATAFAADSDSDGYNDHDYNKIRAFLETVYDGVKNGDRVNNIDYDGDNPNTWAVHWTDGSERCVSTINWSNKGIVGALDLSGCTHLWLLDVSSKNYLTSLDVSNGMAANSSIGCGGNGTGFTALNVSGCSGLESLDCNTDGLSTLDLGSLTGLKELNVNSNKLAALDVTKNINLTNLNCDTNQLKSLDVTKNTNLTYLVCGTNQLTSLDVTKNTNLAGLDCNTNQLTSLDVTKNNNLYALHCNHNQLAALNLNNCAQLWDFDCSSNQLSALDMSQDTSLVTINLNSNRLSTLDVTNNPNILSFTCDDNPLTNIIADFSDAKIQLNAGYGGYLSLDLEAADDSANDTISAIARSISGAAFINWTNADKTQAATNTSYSLSHGGTYHLTANFLALQSSVASGKLYVGDKVTLTPTVAGGTWSFDSNYFTRDGNTFTALKASKDAKTIQYVLNGIHSVYATEVSSLSNISASANNAAYGSVTGMGGYKPNTTATLRATANKGFHFVRWTENGVEVSTNATYSFTVAKDRNLVAVFAKGEQIPVGVACSKTDNAKCSVSNGSITIKASGGNSGAYQYSINNGASWQSSAAFTGLKAGTYTARARDAANTANVSPAVSVTIKLVTPTAYVANKLPAKVSAGAIWLVKPVAAPKGYTLKSISVASNANSIATVVGSNIVKFIKGGKVKLTVTMVYKKGNATKTVKTVKQVTVNERVASITLNTTAAGLKVKKTLKLTPQFYPASATNKAVTWKSSNSKVATVSASGVVTGKAKGTAVITCTAKDGSKASAKCKVTVTK